MKGNTIMMKAFTEQKMKRWAEQRWILDAIISSVGMEWDQPRLGYTMFPCGPDALGDFRTVGMRTKKFNDMHREFAAAASRRQAKAISFEEQDRLVSARESYFIASLLYSAARWPIFEANDLHIGIDGMDGSKEIMCSMYGDKMLERGMASFVYDGPGQGECPVNGLYVTKDNHMEAAQAVYDWLIEHPAIDKDRLVIFGISFGSFFGLQAAAQLGDKVKGAAVSFVCHEPGCYTIFNMAAPSFKLRFMFMSNYDDEDKFDEFISEFSLNPILDKISCPVLIQAGQDEELSPIECTDDVVSKLNVPKKLVYYEGERHAIGGGAAAYLGENWYSMLADWCLDRVNDKKAPNEEVLINSLGHQEITSF